MKSFTEEAIDEICKCHGIENEGYDLEEAKDACGVAEIIKANGIPVKETMCNDWFDGDCGNKNCPDHHDGECEYGGLILEGIGGVG